MATKDREVAAMTKCAEALGELSEAERGRALAWLTDKFGADAPVAYRLAEKDAAGAREAAIAKPWSPTD